MRLKLPRVGKPHQLFDSMDLFLFLDAFEGLCLWLTRSKLNLSSILVFEGHLIVLGIFVNRGVVKKNTGHLILACDTLLLRSDRIESKLDRLLPFGTLSFSRWVFGRQEGILGVDVMIGVSSFRWIRGDWATIFVSKCTVTTNRDALRFRSLLNICKVDSIPVVLSSRDWYLLKLISIDLVRLEDLKRASLLFTALIQSFASRLISSIEGVLLIVLPLCSSFLCFLNFHLLTAHNLVFYLLFLLECFFKLWNPVPIHLLTEEAKSLDHRWKFLKDWTFNVRHLLVRDVKVVLQVTIWVIALWQRLIRATSLQDGLGIRLLLVSYFYLLERG